MLAAEYEIPPGCCDELFGTDGQPLAHAAPLLSALERLGPEALGAVGKGRRLQGHLGT